MTQIDAMTEIQRYATVCATKLGTTESICCTGGEHVEVVLYSDHLSVVQQLEQRIEGLREALKEVRTNVAYAHQPENCGDHCRNSCRDCVLANTLEYIDNALKETECAPNQEPI